MTQLTDPDTKKAMCARLARVEGQLRGVQRLINEDQSYTCAEARYVDELIFYFVPIHYFKLSDDELRDKILEEIG